MDKTSEAGGKSLAQMQGEVFTNNVAKGWHDQPRSFGDEIALLHSEVSEAFEAWRDYGQVDILRYETPGGGFAIVQRGDVNDVAWSNAGMIAKPLSVGSEFADVLIRLLDSCERYGIDLEFEFNRKMAYNRTRPHRHGGKNL